MGSGIRDRWADTYRQWARQRLGAILDTREGEYLGALRWLNLGLDAEFVPLSSIVTDDVDSGGKGLGVKVRRSDNSESAAATLPLIPIVKAADAQAEYAINVAGPCRSCRRPTRLEPTLFVMAGEVREKGTRDVPAMLGQAVVRQRPVQRHDCSLRPADDDATPGGVYL